MLVEFPNTAMTAAQKSLLSTRLHVGTSVIDGRVSSGAVVRMHDGVVVGSASLDGGHRIEELIFLQALSTAIAMHAEDLRGRHVDVRCRVNKALHAFQTRIRGGRCPDPAVQATMVDIDETCRRLSISLTIRKSDASFDEEDAALRILANQLAAERSAHGRGPSSPRHVGHDWRTTLADAIERDMPPLVDTPTIEWTATCSALGRSRRTFGADCESMGILDETSLGIQPIPLVCHILRGLWNDPPVVVFAVETARGRCEIEWGVDGWWARAAPLGVEADPLDAAPDAIRIDACEDAAPPGVPYLRISWWGLLRSAMAAARVIAEAAGRSGRSIENGGDPDELVEWIEEMPEARARTAMVFSDISARDNDPDLGVGYVVVRPDGASHGRAHFASPILGASHQLREPFGSIYALMRAVATTRDVDRIVVVTDCSAWHTRVDRWNARTNGVFMGDELGGRFVAAVEAAGVPVDFLYQKGHTGGVSSMAVGNEFCDRLARLAMTDFETREYATSSEDWIVETTRSVRRLETEIGLFRQPMRLDALVLSYMLDCPVEDIHARWGDHGMGAEIHDEIAWDVVVETLYGRSRTYVEAGPLSPEELPCEPAEAATETV